MRHRFAAGSSFEACSCRRLIFPKVALGLPTLLLFLRVAYALGLREWMLGTPLSIIVVHSLLGLPLVS